MPELGMILKHYMFPKVAPELNPELRTKNKHKAPLRMIPKYKDTVTDIHNIGNHYS